MSKISDFSNQRGPAAVEGLGRNLDLPNTSTPAEVIPLYDQ